MIDQLKHGSLANSTAHLCVDMQNLFAEDTPWGVPWMDRVRPMAAKLARHRPDRTVFTRFIPPDRPEDAPGTWCRYFTQWRELTGERIDPRLLELVPELQELVPPAIIIDKPVFHHSMTADWLRTCESTASIAWSSPVRKPTSACWRQSWPRSITAFGS